VSAKAIPIFGYATGGKKMDEGIKNYRAGIARSIALRRVLPQPDGTMAGQT